MVCCSLHAGFPTQNEVVLPANQLVKYAQDTQAKRREVLLKNVTKNMKLTCHTEKEIIQGNTKKSSTGHCDKQGHLAGKDPLPLITKGSLLEQATGYASQHTCCLSQARINWEGYGRKGIRHKMGNEGGGSLISPDGMAPSQIVGVSASISPCTIKSKKRFSSGTSSHSPGKGAVKWLCVCCLLEQMEENDRGGTG